MTDQDDTLIYHRADVYDCFYRARGKDYAAESAAVLSVCREYVPRVDSLLDVGCGTGRHLAEFARKVPHVEGVDLSPSMLAVAGQHLSTISLHEGDMRTFRLAKKFDAVVCMFSTVGYLSDVAELNRAVSNFRDHLAPGGVLIVEPWWSPETFTPMYVAADSVSLNGRWISRVSHTVRDGNSSKMQVHYLVGEPDSGIEHFSDTHKMTLFSTDEYISAFESAGLDCTVKTLGSGSPGLLIGTRT